MNRSGGEPPARLPVQILASVADQGIASRVAEHLTDRGFQIVPTGAVAVVVVLTPGSADDADFNTRLATITANRIVAVAVGAIASIGLPERLTELNWLLWDPVAPERSLADITAAVQTDLVDYGAARSVEAAAWAWQTSGSGDEGLLRRVADVKKGRQRVELEARALNRAPEPQIQEFLRRSSLFAIKVRRRRRIFVSLWTVLAVTAVTAFVTIIQTSLDGRSRSNLEFVTLSAAILDRAPEVQAAKMSALLLDSEVDPVIRQYADEQLVAALSRPWPVAVFGEEVTKAVNDVAMFGKSGHIWIASGSGELLEYDMAHDLVVRRIPVAQHLDYVASSSAGDTVLAADETTVYLARGTRLGSLPLVTSKLVVSADGRTAAVKSGAGTITALDLSGQAPVTIRSTTWDSVLDVEPGRSGDVLALTRKGDDLTVIDAVTGAVKWHQVLPADSLESGSVAPDGKVAVVARRQIFTSDGAGPFVPTGRYTADIVTAIALSDDGRVYYSSAAYGTQGYDLKLRVPLPQVCSDHDWNQSIQISGQLVMCQGYSAKSLWSAITPTGPSALPTKPSALPPASPVRSVSTAANGAIEVTIAAVGGASRNQTWDWTATSPDRTASKGSAAGDRARTPVTAWTVTADDNSVAVGSAGGQIVELDVTSSGALVFDSSWTAPDNAAVTGLSYAADGTLQVATRTATWSVPTCTGCGADTNTALTAFVNRQRPCYTSNLSTLVTPATQRTLHIRLCNESGL